VVVTATLGVSGLVVGKGGFDTAHSMDAFERVVSVDLSGTFNCVRIAARR
jgi:hypothetical protein